ncbi:LacI family DNA-binding transcriptional regulator [Martelella alba]|uniref:LacI family DNA-binding transcriptional regulator n=1 Tax=Martelella alba TaxID=2590451 RepID=A0ABY2SNN7_9HYPH|nr:LacI family DNA-binding transcriptional regulator [Martelella alba]TKI06717.1 LacI family DNA-binding transcriptional regulator [Martelella alba]
MKPKNATLEDVARHAGVSYQTVSRVLNQSSRVADATRSRVEQAMRELNYVPNRLAQQLAGKPTYTLGLVTASLSWHAPSQIASAVRQSARACGYNVLIAMPDEAEEDALQAALNELKGQRVDGIIINLPLEGERAEAVSRFNDDIPCLFLDVPPQARVPHVMFDPNDGTRASVEYLLSLGHRRFGLLSGPDSSISARLRRQSWLTTLAAHGLTPVCSAQGDWSPESGYRCALNMLRASEAATALLVGNDQMALGVLSASAQLGIGVPDQMSVIGYDDTRDSAFYLPPLSTVSQDFTVLGQQAVDSIIGTLRSGDPMASVMLPTRLIARRSTALLSKPGDISLAGLAEELSRIATRLRG